MGWVWSQPLFLLTMALLLFDAPLIKNLLLGLKDCGLQVSLSGSFEEEDRYGTYGHRLVGVMGMV